MSRGAIRWIIALMSVALIGLISFQLYWIDMLIGVNEERFHKDVQQALNQVAEKLERHEALMVTINNFSSTLFVGRGLASADSFAKEASEVPPAYRVPGQQNEQELFSTWFQYHLKASAGTNRYPTGDSSHTLLSVINQNRVATFSFSGFTYSTPQPEAMTKAALKTDFINFALHELLFTKKMIAGRVNKPQLDSLLKTELENRGVDTEFQYYVWDRATRLPVLFSGGPPHKDESHHTEFRANLFPNDLPGPGGSLVVKFPNQKYFLLQKIWASMASSAVLILTIIFCFGYAVQTIIRQKKLSEIKNDFINNMTHEFKTPISTVALACEALQDEQVAARPDFQKRYLRVISEENKRLGLQVEKVLQTAALDRKDFTLRLEQVNVHEIIARCIDNLAIQVHNRNGKTESLLRAARPLIEADPVHLTNIINNLLDNANKYSPDKPDILVETGDTGGGVVISVTDHGIGMSRESQQKIFDKFYRVPTGNLHDVKGFGLGLAYVKTMVEAHGGSVVVKSQLKKGSTFEIYLPHGTKTPTTDS